MYAIDVVAGHDLDLSDEAEFSRNSISQRLGVLEGHGPVEMIHEQIRLFAFVDDRQEDGDLDR